MRILGIDPGLSGACAVYNSDTGSLHVLDMPTVGIDSDRRVNGVELMDWIKSMAPHTSVIERVNAMPSIPDASGRRRGMGAASAFRFGEANGTIRTVVACLGIHFSYVVPQKWKRHFGIKGSDKELSRQLALSRFPKYADLFTRKKDHQRAEAALLALFYLETGGRL